MITVRPKVFMASIMVLMIVGAASATAQQQTRSSRSSRVVLIARMPETLTFGVNQGTPPDSFSEIGSHHPAQVATSISTSWVLARGRDQVVTWAQVKRPPSPVLIAWAVPTSLPGNGERTADGFSAFHLPTQPLDRISRLDSLTITDANRAATNTICLSDSVGPEEALQPSDDGYAGIMKIKVQAVP